jgi:hypothetical protein
MAAGARDAGVGLRRPGVTDATAGEEDGECGGEGGARG